VFGRTGRLDAINATFTAQVVDVIITDGGADSRDFLTKVQVFSFFLNQLPRLLRNRSRDFRAFSAVSRRGHRTLPACLSTALQFSRSRMFFYVSLIKYLISQCCKAVLIQKKKLCICIYRFFATIQFKKQSFPKNKFQCFESLKFWNEILILKCNFE